MPRLAALITIGLVASTSLASPIPVDDSSLSSPVSDVDLAERHLGVDAASLTTSPIEERRSGDDGDNDGDPDDIEGVPTRMKTTNKYGAGLYANTKNQKSIQKSSTRLTGQYYIRNAKTGAYLYWDIHPQTIIPSKSEKTAMTLSNFGTGTKVKPTPSNDKCLAAQWNSSMGVNWAGTMYACRTSTTEEVDSAHKQMWHFLPVGGAKNTYYIIPEDHLDDMRTRGLSSRTLNTAGGYRSTSVDLFNDNAADQRWIVTKV